MSLARTARRTVAAIIVATVPTACSLAEDGATPDRSAATATATQPGSDDAASPSQVGSDATASSVRRVDPRKGGLEVGFGEFAITLEADQIRPGPVTFVIRNGGALIHGFEIEGEDDDGDHSGSGNGELKLEGPEFGPGNVVRITADLTPGTYEIECFVAEHDDRGMRATLVVTPDAPLVREDTSPAAPDGVEIAGFAFAPGEVHIPTGTEVTWTNVDPAPHTVTDEGGAFDSGTLDPNGAFSFRFDEAGTYRYACAIHPTMRGTVHVA
jgi:plastocyanin